MALLMKHKLCWHSKAWEDYLYWQETNKKIFHKINELIKATARESFIGIGKPEPLQHGLKGFWSRKINREHRLVYSVNNECLIIISCRFHYV
jgi:toxin YoeB